MRVEITLIDRAIIESLARVEKTLLELTIDLDIQSGILRRSLSHLKTEGIIEEREDVYYLSHQSKEVLRKYNSSDSLFSELKEISDFLIETSVKDKASQKNLKLKKVFMDDEELRIFKALSLNLENFLKSVSDKKGQSTKNQYVFFQAHQKYSDLFNTALAL